MSQQFHVVESYNRDTRSFNPHMRQRAEGMYAAGIAATQAQHKRGELVPRRKDDPKYGQKLPRSQAAAATLLRSSPELGVRFLADEMKKAYRGDLASTLPRVALPAWDDPDASKGAYGTQPEYVSRSYAVYKAFAAADRPKTG